MSQEQQQSQQQTMLSLLEGLEKVIRGKRSFLERMICVFAAGGHLLVEDYPGLGKTTAARALAALVSREDASVTFSRIQFTPDLLPYDITGVEVFDQSTGSFHFKQGPIFSHIVLADEVNRTTPKVQSALLEVMAERQVTVGNKTHYLDPLFFVIATQNPIEMEGTYPLPAAQMDRFMMRLSLGYPDRDGELSILENRPADSILPDLEPVCSHEEILELRRTVHEVAVDPRLLGLIADICAATREHKSVEVGISPRGGLMLAAAARALALLQGRSWVADQDIKELAPFVLAHRLVSPLNREQREDLIREVTAREVAKLSS